MIRIIVCGSRTIHNYQLVASALKSIITDPANTEIVSGHAQGPDLLGERFARRHNIKYNIFPANWTKYGKQAGFTRNAQMLEYACQEIPIVLAFWDGKSKGTKHMIDLALSQKIQCYMVKDPL